MWYMPYRRVRQAVLVYGYIIVGLTLAAIALRFWPGAVHMGPGENMIHIVAPAFVVAAAAFVGGFATVLGLNLAAENDGHLEVAWTKPVSREGYALGVFAVDTAAMAVCIIFTAICAIVVVDVYAGYQAVALGSGAEVVRMFAFCGLPLCVYAWIAAGSASLKRNRGVVAGLFWPIMIVLGTLPLLPVPPIHALASVLNLFNPIALYSSTKSVAQGSMTYDPVAATWPYLWGWGVSALLLAAAVAQWRRLQI
jgi:hypothetical protein